MVIPAIWTRPQPAANAFTTSLLVFTVTEKLLFAFIVIQLKKKEKVTTAEMEHEQTDEIDDWK